MWDTIRTGRTDGALVRVMVPTTGDEPRADAAGQSFAEAVYCAFDSKMCGRARACLGGGMPGGRLILSVKPD